MPAAGVPLPPLAVNVETLISIAVLLMGVVGWVVQMAQQGKAQQAARRPPNRGAPDADGRPAGGADEKLRSEIDSFLQEVAGKRGRNRPDQNRPGQNRPGQRGERGPARRGPVDPFEEPPRRARPRRVQSAEVAAREPVGGRRPAPGADGSGADVPDFLRPAGERQTGSRSRPPERTATPAPKPPPKKRQDLRDRKLGRLAKKNLGGELREHVQQYMAVDQSDLAREHVRVKSRLSAAERELSQLKSRLADPNDPARLAPAGDRPAAFADPASLRRLLADPNGVREAIVVNELLSKPLGLRAGRGNRAAGRAVDPAALAAQPGVARSAVARPAIAPSANH